MEECLRRMGVSGVSCKKADVEITGYDGAGKKLEDVVASGWRPYNLNDFSPSLMSRNALEDIVEFARVRERVATESKYSWADAAKDYKVSLSFDLLLSLSSFPRRNYSRL